MQYQVPQFIETEDKIVGPFSLRQFIYLAVGGAISFTLFFTVKTWLWFAMSAIVVAASLAFAFLKINGRPFANFILSAISFYWKPQTYVWQSEDPQLKKQDARKNAVQEGGFIESIVSGMVLKNTWAALQTGTRKKEIPREKQEKIEIFRKLSGEREAARRIDYR